MKIKNILFSILLLFGGLASCQDEISVDLSDRKYVRLNETSISLSTGEKFTVKTSVDSLGSSSKQFVWSVIDPTIATIEPIDNQSAVITGLKEGNTVVKVESSDKEIKYFSDLLVSKDRVIKILAIGNSFSEDAVENYLYDFAKAAGYKVIIGNLYIGGSSLELHWGNASGSKDAYEFRKIGVDGSLNREGGKSIAYAVRNENWDYISFQQVSQLSGILDGYQEFLPKLLDYVKPMTTNPEIKYVLHQTWAYAQSSTHSGFVNYDNDQMKMYNAIVDAVWKAKELAGMDMVIPAGTAIQNGRTSYVGDKFTRDGYHLNLNIGRFTAASAWYEAIFGNILDNSFYPENLLKYDIELAKLAAHEAVKQPKQITELVDYKEPGPNEFLLTKPLFIDFGGVETAEMFNNFKHPNDGKLGNLKDRDGANSNFAIEVSERFTGTLSRGLQNVLGFPKSVSEDMFFSDGKFLPQSSFVVSNLNRDQKYTFVFYGSINDDKTETEFSVLGKNSGKGILDNDNNLGKVVVIENIEPEADATITIQLKPGPNNNHWNLFFGVNAMMILPEGMPVPLEPNEFILEDPVYIDFGTIGAGKPYYYFDRPTDAPRLDIYDEKDNNTGFAMSVTDRFNGDNNSGTTSNTFDLPVAFTQDAFWGNKDNPTSGFTLYRLNSTQKYDLVFYGSRRDVADNRETKYVVKGINEGSGMLDASNNDSKVTVISGIQPTQDGILDIIISAGPNNNNGDGFYYINSLIIVPEGHPLGF